MFLAKHTHQQSHCLTTESDLSCTPVLQYYWVLLKSWDKHTQLMSYVSQKITCCFRRTGAASVTEVTPRDPENPRWVKAEEQIKKTVLRLMLICSNTWKCKKKKSSTHTEWLKKNTVRVNRGWGCNEFMLQWKRIKLSSINRLCLWRYARM